MSGPSGQPRTFPARTSARRWISMEQSPTTSTDTPTCCGSKNVRAHPLCLLAVSTPSIFRPGAAPRGLGTGTECACLLGRLFAGAGALRQRGACRQRICVDVRYVPSARARRGDTNRRACCSWQVPFQSHTAISLRSGHLTSRETTRHTHTRNISNQRLAHDSSLGSTIFEARFPGKSISSCRFISSCQLRVHVRNSMFAAGVCKFLRAVGSVLPQRQSARGRGATVAGQQIRVSVGHYSLLRLHWLRVDP